MPSDDEPPPARTGFQSMPLDRLGVAELRSYIAALQAEITRAEAEIARKQGHRSEADSFFRKP